MGYSLAWQGLQDSHSLAGQGLQDSRYRGQGMAGDSPTGSPVAL